MEKKEKMVQEALHDEEAKLNEEKTDDKIKDDDDTEDSFIYKDQMFSVGDFVYIEPR